MYQPLGGFQQMHEDHSEHHHVPQVLDVSQCSQSPNYLGKYIISTLNSPNCPLMEYDEALNFCMQRNLKSISVKSHMKTATKKDIFSIANLIKPGFWTNGFVKDHSKNMVFWNDMKDDIISELWAEVRNYYIPYLSTRATTSRAYWSKK